jgi:hypothetical protein
MANAKAKTATNLEQAVTNAYNALGRFDEAIEAVKACMGKVTSRKAVQAAIRPIVSKASGVPIVTQQRGEAFDKDHPLYKSAKSKYERIVNAICGVSAKAGRTFDLPEDMIVAMQKLLAKCKIEAAKYEKTSADNILSALKDEAKDRI